MLKITLGNLPSNNYVSAQFLDQLVRFHFDDVSYEILRVVMVLKPNFKLFEQIFTLSLY